MFTKINSGDELTAQMRSVVVHIKQKHVFPLRMYYACAASTLYLPLVPSADACNHCKQIGHKSSVLIWIQTVKHADGIPDSCYFKLFFWRQIENQP